MADANSELELPEIRLEVGSSLGTRLRHGAFLKMKTYGNKLRMYHESQIKFYFKNYDSPFL